MRDAGAPLHPCISISFGLISDPGCALAVGGVGGGGWGSGGLMISDINGIRAYILRLLKLRYVCDVINYRAVSGLLSGVYDDDDDDGDDAAPPPFAVKFD